MNGPGYELSVDRRHDLVTVVYTGVLGLDVAKRALDAANNRTGVSSATLVLLDTTQAIVHQIDVEWLRSYQAYKQSRRYPAQHTALVVSGDEGHQMLGQLWAAIRATATPRAPGVFTDRGAAVQWLLEQRATGGAQTRRA